MKTLVLKIPQALSDNKSKYEFCMNAQESLRLKHNEKGKDFRDGKITKAEWNGWVQDYFNPRSFAISGELVQWRNALLKSGVHAINLDTDFEEK